MFTQRLPDFFISQYALYLHQTQSTYLDAPSSRLPSCNYPKTTSFLQCTCDIIRQQALPVKYLVSPQLIRPWYHPPAPCSSIYFFSKGLQIALSNKTKKGLSVFCTSPTKCFSSGLAPHYFLSVIMLELCHYFNYLVFRRTKYRSRRRPLTPAAASNLCSRLSVVWYHEHSHWPSIALNCVSPQPIRPSLLPQAPTAPQTMRLWYFIRSPTIITRPPDFPAASFS